MFSITFDCYAQTARLRQQIWFSTSATSDVEGTHHHYTLIHNHILAFLMIYILIFNHLSFCHIWYTLSLSGLTTLYPSSCSSSFTSALMNVYFIYYPMMTVVVFLGQNQHEDMKKQFYDLQEEHQVQGEDHSRLLDEHKDHYEKVQQVKESEISHLKGTDGHRNAAVC